MLTENTDPIAAIKVLHETGIECVAVTTGKSGAIISLKNKGHIYAKSIEPKLIMDKTGAGDAFGGGFVNRLINSKKRLTELTLDDISDFGGYANATAALCISKRGGIPAMPSLEEVEEILKNLFK